MVNKLTNEKSGKEKSNVVKKISQFGGNLVKSRGIVSKCNSTIERLEARETH
jgi:hypothetical protein